MPAAAAGRHPISVTAAAAATRFRRAPPTNAPGARRALAALRPPPGPGRRWGDDALKRLTSKEQRASTDLDVSG